ATRWAWENTTDIPGAGPPPGRSRSEGRGANSGTCVLLLYRLMRPKCNGKAGAGGMSGGVSLALLGTTALVDRATMDATLRSCLGSVAVGEGAVGTQVGDLQAAPAVQERQQFRQQVLGAPAARQLRVLRQRRLRVFGADQRLHVAAVGDEVLRQPQL